MNKNKFTKFNEGAGGIVKNDNNQIVLIRMGDVDVWGFPKGRLKKNEKILHAAKREIHEETGIKDLKLIKNLGYYQRPQVNEPQTLKTIHMFLFKTKQETLQPIESDTDSAKWIDKTKASNFLTLSGDKKFFNSIVNEI